MTNLVYSPFRAVTRHLPDGRTARWGYTVHRADCAKRARPRHEGGTFYGYMRDEFIADADLWREVREGTGGSRLPKFFPAACCKPDLAAAAAEMAAERDVENAAAIERKAAEDFRLACDRALWAGQSREREIAERARERAIAVLTNVYPDVFLSLYREATLHERITRWLGEFGRAV